MVFSGAVLEAEAENGMIEEGVFEETDDFDGVEVAHDQDNREPSSHGRGRRWKAVVRTRAAKQGLLGDPEEGDQGWLDAIPRQRIRHGSPP